MSKECLRMCIACRNMLPKNSLIKIVKNKEGVIDFDFKYNKEGRGVYICKNANCIRTVLKKKLLNKALKQNIDDEIYCKIEGLVDE